MKFPKNRICLYSSPFPHDASMARTIDRAAELGLGGVELMNVCTEVLRPDPAAISRLARAAEEKGLAVPCFTVGIDMLPDPDGAAEELIAYARICAENGIPRLHHTIASACSPHDLPAEEREKRFGALLPHVLRVVGAADALGVQVIIEDQGLVFNGIEACMRLRSLTGGKIGILADVGNVFFIDEKPEDFIRLAGDAVVHAHIKDYAYVSDPVPGKPVHRSRAGRHFADVEIGTGDINMDSVARAFAQIGYGGMYSLEFCGVKDGDELGRVLARIAE